MFRLAKQEAQALAIALGLLTRIPVRVRGGASGEVGAATLGRSLHWYPAAGLVIGLILTLLAALLPGDFLLNAKPLNSLLLNAALITRSEEHTSELQSRENLVCCLLLEKQNS